MALHNQLGKKGETLAKQYFLDRGYEVLHVNWRQCHWEIDLLAKKKGVLHVIEVKYRSSPAYGAPEEAVTRKKLKALFRAADSFLFRHPEFRQVQFDILSINEYPGKKPVYFLIEDVYL